MSTWLPSVGSFAKGAFATAAGLSTVGLGLLYYGQNFLIYPSAFPPGSRTVVPVPTEFGLSYEDVTLRTSDAINIHAYLLLQKEDLSQSPAANVRHRTDGEFVSTRPTVIMFHGNAGNHGHRIPLAKVFYIKMRCNVLMVSYRGYGRSEGTPSEKGLCIDAQTALDYVKSDPQLSQTPIVLYGQSIGGAVAIDLASRNTIRALILENTFTSLPQLVPHALPALSPFTFLCHQKWNSAAKIPLIPASTPILLLSGMRDEVVPNSHMRALWDLVARRGERTTTSAGGKDLAVGLARAQFKEFEFGTHNDTCVQPGYWTAVSDFVLDCTS